MKWCTVSKDEKAKCDKWSAVSEGGVDCAIAETTEECITKIMVRAFPFPTALSMHLPASGAIASFCL